MSPRIKDYSLLMSGKSFKDLQKDKKNSKKSKENPQLSKEDSNKKESRNLKNNKTTYTKNSENLRKTNEFLRKNSKNYKNSAKNPQISQKFELINTLFSTNKIPQDAQKVIKDFDELVQSIAPLNSKQHQQLAQNIQDLSHQMTDQRADRRLGYMNENVQLSAYVRYFMWWNLVRLTRLFSSLPESSFPEKDGICLDLGSGPLTLVTALWLARPELREKNLTWYCLDVSQNSLSMGENIYLSVASKTPPLNPDANPHWKIIRVKGNFGSFLKQKADFICCGNMFNELDQASTMPPEYQSKKYYDQLRLYGEDSAKYLLVEPGVPKSSRTLSLLRERFIKDDFSVIAPCVHAEACPMNGFKAYTGSSNKWCNFAFSTEDAPAKLQKLSTNAKLPKERAVLSFISVSKTTKNLELQEKENTILLRLASDSFTLPRNKTGFYACSRLGLTLVSTNAENNLKSGDLIQVKTKTPDSSLKTDEKSGAPIIEI